MGTNPFTGTTTIAERTQSQALVFKTLAKNIARKLRCGLPGVIREFDPVTQYATVRLALTENLLASYGRRKTPTSIKDLYDVLVLFPGDVNWCLTFPSVVGAECYVCFADMCINAWATYGFKDPNGKLLPQDQEIERRHDLSDGFAILSPRSQPNRIPSFSTNNVELRSMDGNTKLALTPAGTVILKGSGLEIDGTGGVIVKPGNTPSTASIQVTINGVVWYVRSSSAP